LIPSACGLSRFSSGLGGRQIYIRRILVFLFLSTQSSAFHTLLVPSFLLSASHTVNPHASFLHLLASLLPPSYTSRSASIVGDARCVCCLAAALHGVMVRTRIPTVVLHVTLIPPPPSKHTCSPVLRPDRLGFTLFSSARLLLPVPWSPSSRSG
jgi:hypothetical protein